VVASLTARADCGGAFDCVVLDPQTDGMGQGEYQSDKLLSGWNFGNEFACAVISSTSS
jgi:hypothetical protein